jgi:hypothetical protein
LKEAIMGTQATPAYSPAVADLLREERLAPLGPGTPNDSARDPLRQLRIETDFAPAPVLDEEMAACCLAGLWLYHDFLDEAHTLSQEISTSSGSFWHGIMHRREPDYGNAAYWFRRVGSHPVFAPLHAAARQVAAAGSLPPEAGFVTQERTWDPFAFIDLCEAVAGTGSAAEDFCRRMQRSEWHLLFDFCYRRALGISG